MANVTGLTFSHSSLYQYHRVTKAIKVTRATKVSMRHLDSLVLKELL